MLGSRRNLKSEVVSVPVASEPRDYESHLQSNANIVSGNDPANSVRPISLKEQLKDWALKHKPSRECCNDILAILARQNLDVPRDIRSLIPKKSKLVIKSVPPGFYSHFGIEKQLMSFGDYVSQFEEIVFDINVDGIPLFRSSRVQLWPILIRILNFKVNNILPVGIYIGKQKPKDLEVYLLDFVQEHDNLSKTGICVSNKIVKLRLRAVICDAPATAFICGTVGHTSSHGCSKCTQVARKIDQVLTYTTNSDKLITDEDFTERRLKNHFSKKFRSEASPLETLNIKMVSQIALDTMHLIDLGVVRKFLIRLLNNKTSLEYKAPKENLSTISTKLVSLRKYIPLEFSRRPRGFEDIVHWKATEYRQFLLYTGILALKGSIHDELYYEFLLLHCSCRLLSCPRSYEENISLCQNMLSLFVENFPIVFKENSVSYNVHSLLHLTECVKQFGVLQNFFGLWLRKLSSDFKRLRKKTTMRTQANLQ
ncbi:uncharacterized protein LOC118750465 [Rhagoletis pomonella]|uniref:uncharacterized protein LOC118750465 n=1 Tax=Rhagoletis pomonella TaxID=28610 RepID=UPI001785F79F|nr:uncharacterized protein LOC118750465 [Rhagoletis pomonella]